MEAIWEFETSDLFSESECVALRFAMSAAFAEEFGAPIAQLNELVVVNTVTIAKLMEIAPPDTTEPPTKRSEDICGFRQHASFCGYPPGRLALWQSRRRTS